MITIIVTSVLATFVLVLIGLNFAPPEKKLERRIEHPHRTDDPQFLREMAVLLGPAIVQGNKVEVLQNGQEISRLFDAVRSARRSITFET